MSYTAALLDRYALAPVPTQFCGCACEVAAVFLVSTKADTADYGPFNESVPPSAYRRCTATTTTTSGSSPHQTTTTVATFGQASSAAGASVTSLACKWKVRATWTAPWPSDGSSIALDYRIRTVTHSGTKTTTEPQGDPATYDYAEDAEVSYGGVQTVTLMPSPGSTSVESGVTDLDAGTAYAELSLIGSADPQVIPTVTSIDPERAYVAWAIQFQFAAYEKHGFPPYLVADAASGPVSLYRTETYSGVDAFGVPFGGSQTVTVADDNINTSVTSDGVSVNVPAALRSQIDGDDEDTVGRPAGLVDTSLDLIRTRARIVTPTQVTWDNGMIATLSDPDPTTRITALLPSNDATALAGGTSLPGIVRLDSLPTDERSCARLVGRYRPELGAAIFAAIDSAYAGSTGYSGPPKYAIPSGSIEVEWQEITVDLAAGTRASETKTHTYALDPDGALPGDIDWITPTGTANQALLVSGLRVTTGSLPSLNLPPQVRVVPG